MKFKFLPAIVAAGLACSVITPAQAQTTLLDTFTNADGLTFTGSMPRTYMGDAFTNNSLPAGTSSFQITSLTIYLVTEAAAEYTDVVARLQFWNTVSTASTPVFSSAAGSIITIDLGALSATATTFYSFNITLSTPITLTGGSGHNWGFAQNFRGSTTGGTPADDSNLTSLITSNSLGGYAAGQVTTGTSPAQGYYRNASGRTDLNFATGDSRSLTGLNSQGIAIIINGTPVVPEPSTNALLLGACGLVIVARWMRIRRLA